MVTEKELEKTFGTRAKGATVIGVFKESKFDIILALYDVKGNGIASLILDDEQLQNLIAKINSVRITMEDKIEAYRKEKEKPPTLPN